MRGPDPKFKEGDRVVDFKGRKALVISVEKSRAWRSKSHRVTVQWDNVTGPDRIAYYEEVFSHDSDHG